MTRHSLRRPLAAVATSALLLIGCGGDSDDTDNGDTDVEVTETAEADTGDTDTETETIDCGTVDGPCDYGDDPELDALWDACEGGDGQACDDLYFESPFGSRYEQFGDTCGDRGFEPSCAEVYD